MQYVALYARVSTQNQTTGLEAQIRALNLYCSNQKIIGHKLFQDEGVSGAKERRPGLDALIAAVNNGEISAVIVYSFSRFARSTKHLLAALETFNTAGIAFVSLSESLNTMTPAGKMVFTVLAAVAELERSLIQERVKNGLGNARAKGKPLGRPKVRNTKLIAELLHQGLTYRKISELADCSHWCIREVAKELQSTETVAEPIPNQKTSVG